VRIPRALSVLGVIAVFSSSASAQGAPAAPAQQAPPMVLSTTAWADGTLIPAKYTQAGDQTSPEFTWTNAPAGTRSFVFNMLDPDVAVQRTPEPQPHWIVWNIPATATGMPEGVKPGAQLPDGSRQISASGPQYRGPGAAASGPLHHYTFEVYALDEVIDIAPSVGATPIASALETRANVMKAMQGHVLGKAVYVGLFHRPK
jgi:hypothetical protein